MPEAKTSLSLGLIVATALVVGGFTAIPAGSGADPGGNGNGNPRQSNKAAQPPPPEVR
jgi:hypothetical protein